MPSGIIFVDGLAGAAVVQFSTTRKRGEAMAAGATTSPSSRWATSCSMVITGTETRSPKSSSAGNPDHFAAVCGDLAHRGVGVESRQHHRSTATSVCPGRTRDTAGHCAQRKHVTRPGQGARGRHGIGENPQRVSAVGGADPGAFAVSGIDCHRVGGAAGIFVVLDHRRQVQRVRDRMRIGAQMKPEELRTVQAATTTASRTPAPKSTNCARPARSYSAGPTHCLGKFWTLAPPYHLSRNQKTRFDAGQRRLSCVGLTGFEPATT